MRKRLKDLDEEGVSEEERRKLSRVDADDLEDEDEDEDEGEPIYKGETDEEGLKTGFGTIEYPGSIRFEGYFISGKR